MEFYSSGKSHLLIYLGGVFLEDVIDFVQTFKGLEARINEFINEDSSLEYVEGSEEVVAGGA